MLGNHKKIITKTTNIISEKTTLISFRKAWGILLLHIALRIRGTTFEMVWSFLVFFEFNMTFSSPYLPLAQKLYGFTGICSLEPLRVVDGGVGLDHLGHHLGSPSSASSSSSSSSSQSSWSSLSTPLLSSSYICNRQILWHHHRVGSAQDHFLGQACWSLRWKCKVVKESRKACVKIWDFAIIFD